MRKKLKTNFHDELNFARFGVISMLSRIDLSVANWKMEFDVGGRTYRIEAITPEGRPHGIDTDTLVALETLFVANGCPDDNWLHTTAYEVREIMGLANNGKSYHRIRESLRRLYLTSVIVGRKTAITGKRASWDNVGVRFLDGFRYRDLEDGEINILDGEATLSIRLGEQLAESIRSGASHVLDGQLLHQLEQPPARALYRTLQAHRQQDDGSHLKELQVPLADWRQATGLTTDRIDQVRRALQAAHSELLANGYLEHASIEGRGSSAYALYRFADVHAADAALVMLLRQAGVTVSRAASLATRYPERVEQAIQFLEQRQAVAGGTIRNPGGLVADFLEHPEKYDLAQEYQASEQLQQERRNALDARRKKEVEEAQQQTHNEIERLAQCSPAEQWNARKGTLQVMLKKHLNPEEWTRLEELSRCGEISAVELTRRLSVASVQGGSSQLQEEVAALKKSLLPA